jgi:hypothetical protein
MWAAVRLGAIMLAILTFAAAKAQAAGEAISESEWADAADSDQPRSDLEPDGANGEPAPPAIPGATLYAVAGVSSLSPAWAIQPLEAAPASVEPEAAPRARKRIFFNSWVAITSVEVALLATTAALPRDWTGWSDHFIQDGLRNLGRAYSRPPSFDSDEWYHNYLGHPYGGSVYYNTIRSQGGTKTESFLFSLLLSTQWEYVFEAVAERPSIQDLIVTPVSGRVLGEAINRMTLTMVKGGTNLLEKVAITVLNPMYVVYRGF